MEYHVLASKLCSTQQAPRFFRSDSRDAFGIDGHESAVLHDELTVDDHVLDVARLRRINEGTERLERGRLMRAVGANDDQIRTLADFDGANVRSDAQKLRALAGSKPKNITRRQRSRTGA